MNHIVTYLSGLEKQHGGGGIKIPVIKCFNDGYDAGRISSPGSGISEYSDQHMFFHVERSRIQRTGPIRTG